VADLGSFGSTEGGGTVEDVACEGIESPLLGGGGGGGFGPRFSGQLDPGHVGDRRAAPAKAQEAGRHAGRVELARLPRPVGHGDQIDVAHPVGEVTESQGADGVTADEDSRKVPVETAEVPIDGAPDLCREW
jgi:hypothetical protein